MGLLFDHIFAASNSIVESCFNEITKEAAMTLFGFSESVGKKQETFSQENVPCFGLVPGGIGSLARDRVHFSFESTSVV
ncbi:hypothetical protein ACFX12_043835 [Malus domestica]